MEENSIAIIEGPPPTFETAHEYWTFGLGEGPRQPFTVLTRLRTFNGSALVERCYRRWRANQSIYLRFRNQLGMEEMAPILAARSVTVPEGDVLLVWVNLNPEQTAAEMDSDEDAEQDGSD